MTGTGHNKYMSVKVSDDITLFDLYKEYVGKPLTNINGDPIGIVTRVDQDLDGIYIEAMWADDSKYKEVALNLHEMSKIGVSVSVSTSVYNGELQDISIVPTPYDSTNQNKIVDGKISNAYKGEIIKVF